MIINILSIIGTIAFAISGTLSAQHKNMDWFGVIVVANITAIGGGTLRDLLIHHPVFWMQDPRYLSYSTAAAIVILFIPRASKQFLTLLYITDAVGLGVFTIIGIGVSLPHTTPLIASIMGVLTGIGGGMLRDVLCGEVPLVLQKEIYATASIVGAIVYFIAQHFNVNTGITTGLGIVSILCLRLGAIYWRWSLPKSKTIL